MVCMVHGCQTHRIVGLVWCETLKNVVSFKTCTQIASTKRQALAKSWKIAGKKKEQKEKN